MCPVAFDIGPLLAKEVVGVDVGSTFSKVVVFWDYSILAWAIIPSGGNYRAAGEAVVKEALAKANVPFEKVGYIVATGYGAASVPFAGNSVTDISCLGRGVAYLFPSVRTGVDIGGQFTRVFKIDKKGKVTAFVISEKCAAGSGRFLQVMARVLQVDLEQIGELSLKSRSPVDFSAGCAVFAESEAISRIAEGAGKEDILAGVHQAMAAKIQSLVERIGFEPDCALVGGGAKDIGLVQSVEKRLGSVLVPQEPQIVAALGAAIIAEEKVASPRPVSG